MAMFGPRNTKAAKTLLSSVFAALASSGRGWVQTNNRIRVRNVVAYAVSGAKPRRIVFSVSARGSMKLMR